MFSREDLEEDVFATEHGRDGVDSSREGLAEEDHVGLDLGVVLEAEELARASETLCAHERQRDNVFESIAVFEAYSLNFVADEEDIVLFAERLNSLEVVLVRDDDTAAELRSVFE